MHERRVVRGEWKTCKRIRLVETSSHTMKPVTPSRDWFSVSPSPKYESCPVKTVGSVFPYLPVQSRHSVTSTVVGSSRRL